MPTPPPMTYLLALPMHMQLYKLLGNTWVDPQPHKTLAAASHLNSPFLHSSLPNLRFKSLAPARWKQTTFRIVKTLGAGSMLNLRSFPFKRACN